MRTDTADVVVIGAGPAGLAAATAAAESGARTVLVAEAPVMAEHRSLRASGVQVLTSASVWGLFPGWEVYLTPVDPADSERLPDRLAVPTVVAALGSTQRPIPFPGWTLPGVVAVEAVYQMLNVWGILPGRRVVVAGTDAVGREMAARLRQAGAEVLLCQPPPGTYSPPPAPGYSGPTLIAAVGKERVTGARIADAAPSDWAGKATERVWRCDLIVTSGGVLPLVDLVASAGCPLRWAPEFDAHVPEHDAAMETPLAGIFVAGSMTGAPDAATAAAQGRLAGSAAAAAAARLTPGGIHHGSNPHQHS